MIQESIQWRQIRDGLPDNSDERVLLLWPSDVTEETPFDARVYLLNKQALAWAKWPRGYAPDGMPYAGNTTVNITFTLPKQYTNCMTRDDVVGCPITRESGEIIGVIKDFNPDTLEVSGCMNFDARIAYTLRGEISSFEIL